MNAPLNPVHLQVMSSLCPAHTVYVLNTHLMKLHYHQLLLPQDKIQNCHLCATPIP